MKLSDDLIHLHSPANLAMADTILAAPSDQWQPYPHLMLINEELLKIARGDVKRLMVNMPAQHGKSMLTTIYFIAWILLVFPTKRVILLCYNEQFGEKMGGDIKEIVERWGGTCGVKVKKDTSAKAFWKVECSGSARGQLRATGFGGSVAGLPADILVVDDLVKGDADSLTPTHFEKLWQFYLTVVTGRARGETAIVMVGTRWSKYDPCGRVLSTIKKTGEEWKVLNLAALAEENDPLGRKPGEALCEQLKPRAQLEMERIADFKTFATCRQQHPREDSGVHFTPGGCPQTATTPYVPPWPVYLDLGNGTVSLPAPQNQRKIWLATDLMRFVTVDWAMSDKKWSDYTAVGFFDLTPTGELLILDIVNQRTSVEQCVPLLAKLCSRWKPSFGVVEADGFQAALAREVYTYPQIPELERRKHKNRTKLARAQPAIIMGQNGRIYFPACVDEADLELLPPTARRDKPLWYDDFVDQLASFTGEGGAEKDDMVDMLGLAATKAQELRGAAHRSAPPVLLMAGRDTVFGR